MAESDAGPGGQVSAPELAADQTPRAEPPAATSAEHSTAGSAHPDGHRARIERGAGQCPGRAERSGARWSRSVLVSVVALGLLVVLLSGGGVLLYVNGAPARTDDAARSDALRAARQAAVNLTTINYRTADADVKRISDSSTGDFADQFDSNADSFSGVVKQAKVDTSGQVLEAGVDKIEGNSVRVLVAVRSSVANTETQQPQQRDYRMAITEQLIGGRWLASNVEFIP